MRKMNVLGGETWRVLETRETEHNLLIKAVPTKSVSVCTGRGVVGELSRFGTKMQPGVETTARPSGAAHSDGVVGNICSEGGDAEA